MEWTLSGHAGTLVGRTWPNPDASWLAVLAHGYGEHIGRYEHVARALVTAGAVVLGHDHAGHGRSDGERALITDFEPVVDDEHLVVRYAKTEFPSLPTVLIGHSMGGMIAARYAQRFPADLAALVLSGPLLGSWPGLDLLELDELPDEPIAPAVLSRDESVGAAYAADPLVWHGPLARQTLLAIDECLHTIDFDHPLGDDLPALWLHGEDDQLVPMVETRTGMDRIRGLRFEEAIYPGARHEVFNETNSAQVLADLTDFVHRTVLIGH